MIESLEVPPPSAPRGLVFRVGFIYWTLFCALIVTTNTDATQDLFDWLTAPVYRAVAWLGHHVLGIDRAIGIESNGSGDRLVDWLALLGIAVIAVVGGAVWAALDRRRAHDDRLRELLRVVMRYTLAFSVLGYGIAKLLLGQFPAPDPSRLTQPFGEASPMGLMWTFMGASPLYVFFSGAAETVGALLLLFRRTTLLGALVLVGVMTNVVMLNLCYDVPVKILSAHYLAIAICLVLPDLGRLANVALHNRAAAPRVLHLVLAKRWMRIARRGVKAVAIAAVLIVTTRSNLAAIREYYPAPAPPTWYSGHWLVTLFERDLHAVPLARSDPRHWRKLRINAGKVTARYWTGEDPDYGPSYAVTIDEAAGTFTFVRRHEDDFDATGPERFVLRYRRIDAEHLELAGALGAEQVVMQLEHVDVEHSLLMTRGFHWINDAPYNR